MKSKYFKRSDRRPNPFSEPTKHPSAAEIAAVAARLPGTIEKKAADAVRLVWECARAFAESLEEFYGHVEGRLDKAIWPRELLAKELDLSPLTVNGKILSGDDLLSAYLAINLKFSRYKDLPGLPLAASTEVPASFKLWRADVISRNRSAAAKKRKVPKR